MRWDMCFQYPSLLFIEFTHPIEIRSGSSIFGNGMSTFKDLAESVKGMLIKRLDAFLCFWFLCGWCGTCVMYGHCIFVYSRSFKSGQWVSFYITAPLNERPVSVFLVFISRWIFCKGPIHCHARLIVHSHVICFGDEPIKLLCPTRHNAPFSSHTSAAPSSFFLLRWELACTQIKTNAVGFDTQA